METKSKDDKRFSTEERRALATVPWIVGAAVSEVDKGGAQEAANAEMRAMNAAIHGGIAAFSSDTMIDLVEEVELVRWATAKAEVVSRCSNALALIKAKGTAEEVEAYKKLIMDVAYEVARASGSGFAGLGKKVSDLESGMIDTIARAMDAIHLKAK